MKTDTRTASQRWGRGLNTAFGRSKSAYWNCNVDVRVTRGCGAGLSNEKRGSPTGPASFGRPSWHLSEPDLFDLIAVSAGPSLDATHSRTADAANKQRLAHADQLAETMGLNMTQYWTPTAEGFFSRVNRTAILDAVAEATSDKAARRLDG